MKHLNDDLVELLLGEDDRASALVLDADRTLNHNDTGRQVGAALGVNAQIRSIFEARGYTPAAFIEVAKSWGEIPESVYFNEIKRVVSTVTLRTGWQRIFPQILDKVWIAVVTAGIPQLWRWTLDAAGFSEIPVIGGCRWGTDPYVVCPDGKSSVVRYLQRRNLYVTAAGDSLIDLPMLQQANRGLIVPDRKGSPRLMTKLQESDHDLSYLALDNRVFDVPPLSENELIEELLERPC